MIHRVVLLGATGAFGRRLAGRLKDWSGIELVLAARGRAGLEALAAELRAAGASAKIAVAVVDRERPEGVAALQPFAVIDAAGPFQGGDLALPRAVIAAGAHYLDLADARDFVARFPALDAEARAAGVLAVTGASSTPALSNAALDAITAGWRRIDQVTVAISPGALAPRGLSVVRAILSYVGRPVRVWREGSWRMEPGWSGPRRLRFPGLGRRWVALCETPDLDVLAGRAVRTGEFLAGLELGLAHLGLWLLSWPVRVGLVRSLEPFARTLRALSGLFVPFGSDRGGMVVIAQGEGPAGERLAARWSLAAQANAGPTVPVAAAAAVLRALLQGRMTARGAMACVGLVNLDAILAELGGLPVRTRRDEAAPQAPDLLHRLLGRRADTLPAAVKAVHARTAPATFRGSGKARGARNLVARLARAALGLPEPGAYPGLAVTIAPDARGETWTRDFGPRGFASRLVSGAEPGAFQERMGPLRFAFEAQPMAGGFRWRFAGWRLGPMPLPNTLAPSIRAASFARRGVYRFRAVAAYPGLGLLFAYSGRLNTAGAPGGPS